MESPAADSPPITTSYRGIGGALSVGRTVRLVFFSAAVFCLLWFFRASTYRGDGDLIARYIEGRVWYYEREPLLHFFLVLTPVLLSPWHLDGMQVLNIFSCLSGAAFFLILVLLARDWLGDPLPAFAVFFASGFAILFAGHTEYYAPAMAVALFWMERTFRRFRGEVSLRQPLWAYALFASFHLVAVFVAPAVLFMLWRERSALLRSRTGAALPPQRTGFARELVIGFLPLAFLALYLWTAPPSPTDLHVGPRLVPLHSESYPPPGRIGILSAEHLAGWFYWQVKASPVGIPLLLLFLSPGVRRRIRSGAFERFLAICAAGLLLFSAIWHPDLGVWRDWDLFAIVTLPTTLLGIAAWRAAGTGLRRAIWILLLPAALWTWSSIVRDAKLGSRGRGTIEIRGLEGKPTQINVDGHIKKGPVIYNVLEGTRDVRVRSLADRQGWREAVRVFPGGTTVIEFQIRSREGRDQAPRAPAPGPSAESPAGDDRTGLHALVRPSLSVADDAGHDVARRALRRPPTPR